MTAENFSRWIGAFGNSDTGAAWLSSARVVRFGFSPVTSATLVLASTSGGHSKETAGDKPEEGGDDVKSSWPLRARATRATMVGTKVAASREVELIHKPIVVRIAVCNSTA